MVNDDTKIKIYIVLLVLWALLLSACANYQFGDISRMYCGSTNAEIRADLKVTLQENGLSIGIDYCASAGLVDALIVQPIQNKKNKEVLRD